MTPCSIFGTQGTLHIPKRQLRFRDLPVSLQHWVAKVVKVPCVIIVVFLIDAIDSIRTILLWLTGIFLPVRNPPGELRLDNLLETRDADPT